MKKNQLMLKKPVVGADYCRKKEMPSVTGLLDKEEGRHFKLLFNTRWNLLPPYLSNEPGTGLLASHQGPHLRTPKLRVTPGSTPRIYYITEGV
jgi:hypothetical protein